MDKFGTFYQHYSSNANAMDWTLPEISPFCDDALYDIRLTPRARLFAHLKERPIAEIVHQSSCRTPLRSISTIASNEVAKPNAVSGDLLALKAFEDLYEHNVKPILTELQVLDFIQEDHVKGTDGLSSLSCFKQPYFSSSSSENNATNVADKADFFVQCHVPAAYQQEVQSYDQLRSSTPHDENEASKFWWRPACSNLQAPSYDNEDRLNTSSSDVDHSGQEASSVQLAEQGSTNVLLARQGQSTVAECQLPRRRGRPRRNRGVGEPKDQGQSSQGQTAVSSETKPVMCKQIDQLEFWSIILNKDGSVRLEGYVNGRKRCHRTRAVVKRLHGKVVETSSGSRYRLIGQQQNKCPDIPDDILLQFQHRFPWNWKELIRVVHNERLSKELSLHSTQNPPVEEEDTHIKEVTNTVEQKCDKQSCHVKTAPVSEDNFAPSKRSGRLRYPPLAYWANQRLIVSPNFDRNTLIKGSKNELPEVIDICCRGSRKKKSSQGQLLKTDEEKPGRNGNSIIVRRRSRAHCSGQQDQDQPLKSGTKRIAVRPHKTKVGRHIPADSSRPLDQTNNRVQRLSFKSETVNTTDVAKSAMRAKVTRIRSVVLRNHSKPSHRAARKETSERDENLCSDLFDADFLSELSEFDS